MGLISSGRIWPYGITISIIMVFGFCVSTIYVTMQRPVEKSDTYMMGYHHADLGANELIQAEIDFNRKYKITYITESLAQEGSTLKYTVHDLDGNAVNDAEVLVMITRPNHHREDQELINPSIENGVYSFSNFTLAQPGRWDIMARVKIGELQRFYNIKADTRATEVFEY